MNAIVQFPVSDARPCNVSALDDPLVGEWSERGREPMGWAGIAGVLAAIFGPLALAWMVFG